MMNGNFNTYLNALQNKTIQGFNIIPEDSSDRNKAIKYEKALQKFEKFVSDRSDKIIDALTDSVRDFLTPKDMIDMRRKFETIFSSEMGEDLREFIKTMENSLPINERNSIIKSKIIDINKEVNNIRKEILSKNWGISIEETEKFTVLSQMLSLSCSLIQIVIDDINWGSKDSLKDVNFIVGMVFYLIIKFIAMIKGKVTLESLNYAVSTVQVALSDSGISTFF